jgi:flagellar export protein FliJ
MTPREKRVQRVVELRDQRLKLAVRTFEETRQLEQKAAAEFVSARDARAGAERERRALSTGTNGIQAFIEAEEWLRACTAREEFAAQRARQVRMQLEKARARLQEAVTKLRQLERLAERLAQQRRLREARAERRLDDEIGQRIAQSGQRRKGGA